MIEHIPERYNCRVVFISNGEWSQAKNLTVIKRLKDWDVELLEMDNNRRVEIMREISHIRFSCLKLLGISGNCIESVEGLVSLAFPHLQSLDLFSNNINCLWVLRKAFWPSLSSLSVSGNYMRDHWNLTQGNFSCLKDLNVLYSEDKNKFAHPWFPCKLETKVLKQLRKKISKAQSQKQNYFHSSVAFRGDLKANGKMLSFIIDLTSPATKNKNIGKKIFSHVNFHQNSLSVKSSQFMTIIKVISFLNHHSFS